MIPGEPVRTYEPDGDDRAFADWMLELIDESPDKLAMIGMRRSDVVPRVDEVEDALIRAYDLAKAERPDLGVQLLPVLFRGSDVKDGSDVLVVLHEHKWVGGQCVNGCRDRREVD